MNINIAFGRTVVYLERIMTTKKVIVRDLHYGWKLVNMNSSEHRWYRMELIHERMYGENWEQLDFDCSYEI